MNLQCAADIVPVNLPANTVTILDRTIPLAATNVVVVDDADGSGPRVVGTRRIEPFIAGTGDVLPLIFKQTPELREFLRCDDGLPNGWEGADEMKLLIDPVCGSTAK